MEYVDFVDATLRASALLVTSSHDARLVGVAIAEIARSLELDIDPMSPEFHASDQRMALIHAGSDLCQLGLAEAESETGGYWRIKLTDRGRRATSVSLRTYWPALFERGLIDDEMRQFLGAAVARSEHRAERFAIMRDTTAKEVFEGLGWPWDLGHAIALTGNLENNQCLHAWPTMGGPVEVRVTYIGVVLGTQEQETRDQQLLGELVEDWETTTVDFKRELDLDSKTARLDFAHDVLTIANVQGRQRRAIVVGFDPRTRETVKTVDPRITQDRLEDVVNANTKGRPPEIRWRKIPWRGIVVGLAEIVRDATALPYRAGDALRDIYGGEVFVRRGTHSALADEHELADLVDEATRACARRDSSRE